MLPATVLACALVAIGCSGGSNPVAPNGDLTGNAAAQSGRTHLWGYYNVYIDISSQTAAAVLDRSAMFTANVTQFVNGSAANLGFAIVGTPAGADYVDVDIDVTIKHPFPGLPQYNGYDVRGVFMGDGSGSLNYNPDLIYPALGADQFMLADPVDGFGGPDGYTRWFNKAEFSTGGSPMFQYTQGNVATPGFNGNATLNAYKYFADGLGVTDDLWTWLGNHADQHSVFSSGSANTRNYYLRFPNSKGIVFGYAIIANWKGPEPENHPANAPEAAACSVVDASDLYYVSPSNKGGKLKLDMSIWNWDAEIVGGVMEDYRILVESTVLSAVHEFSTSEMTPTGGDGHFSTYQVEIPADNILGVDGNEYWVIVEEKDADYTNDFGVTNLADTDKLAAFFRYDLYVSPSAYKHAPVAQFTVVTPMPAVGWSDIPVTFHSTSYDVDLGETATLTYYWDFDGDGTFNGPLDTYTGPATDPVHTYTADYSGTVSLQVKDTSGLWSNVFTCDPLSVTRESCGTFVFPTSWNYYWNGGNYLIYYPCDATHAANPSKVIGSCSGYSSIAAYPPTSGGPIYDVSAGYTVGGLATTSTDRCYFYDASSTIQIFYTDYTNASGFQNMHTAFSGGPVPTGNLNKICVDDTDNPVALTFTAATVARIYRCSGSSWGAGVAIPPEVWAVCASYSYITDLEFDPTTTAGGPCYLITCFNPSNNHPGIFALKASDGSVLWKDTDIWPTGDFNYSWVTCGVEVPMSMASCHIICFAGKGNGAANGTYLARYNPGGGEKATTFYAPGSFSSLYTQAALVLDNSVTPNVWRLYGNGAWSNNCISLNLPSGW
jgi:hypothetical protein